MILYVLNRFILWNLKIYNGTSASFYNDNDEFSNISNSSEVKESYPNVCDDVVRNLDVRTLRKKILN